MTTDRSIKHQPMSGEDKCGGRGRPFSQLKSAELQHWLDEDSSRRERGVQPMFSGEQRENIIDRISEVKAIAKEKAAKAKAAKYDRLPGEDDEEYVARIKELITK